MKTVEEIAHDIAGDGADALLDRQFRAPGIQALPDLLQPFVFDHYLLAGRHAIIALQRVLNEKGEDCPRSGSICPATLRARSARVPARLARLGLFVLACMCVCVRACVSVRMPDVLRPPRTATCCDYPAQWLPRARVPIANPVTIS